MTTQADYRLEARLKGEYRKPDRAKETLAASVVGAWWSLEGEIEVATAKIKKARQEADRKIAAADKARRAEEQALARLHAIERTIRTAHEAQEALPTR